MDFTQYDGPTPEWTAVWSANPLPEIPRHLPPAEIQRLANEAGEKRAAEAMLPLADKVTLKDHTIPTRDGSTLEARSYRPVAAGDSPLPVYLFFHGGGFITGSIGKEDANCALVALGANVAVLHVNYRHAPQHTYPTAWLDAADGFLWLHDHMADVNGIASSVVVGGVSAGANLAASLALQATLGKLPPHPPLAGVVLMVPFLTHPDAREGNLALLRDPALSSYETNKFAPALPVSAIRMFTETMRFGDVDPRDLRLSPGNATVDEVRGFPPTTMGVSGLDPLRDEGLLFAKLLAEAGVPTDTYLFMGMPHSFKGYGDRLSEVKRWDDTIVNGIGWALSKPEAGEFNVQTA